jgi:hypothetical protein
MTAKKAFPQKSFPATVTFRPDQFATVRRLQDARKLSEVCQKAVDLDAELEALPDGVRTMPWKLRPITSRRVV